MNDKLSNLTTIPVVDRASDLLYVVDTSGGTSNKATPNEVLGITGNPVGTTDIQTLTQKTLTSPTINTPTLTVNDNALTIQDNVDTTKKVLFELSGITAGQTRTLTVPDASTTLVGTGVTQTLTNKTLTAPTITNPTLTVDTISEFTSANGVTIDGLNIKDGALNTANSVPNTALSNTGAWDSDWAWVSWVPAFTNLAGGTLNFAKYQQIGKTVYFKLKYTMSGANVSGATGISFSLPVSPNADEQTAAGYNVIGYGNLLDSGTANINAMVSLTTTSIAVVLAENSVGTYGQQSITTSTVPFTWAVNDNLYVRGFYEAS